MAIFGSSATEQGTRQWIDAERAGARFAGAGLTIVTGGYSGTMEAASKGASLGGGHVIGVTAGRLFRGRSAANPYVTEELTASTLSERIGILTELAHGAIVLPGSIGTAAELVLSWNMNQVVRVHGGRRMPTVAVGEEWREVSAVLTRAIGASPGDVHTVDTTDEAVDWLLAQPEIQ